MSRQTGDAQLDVELRIARQDGVTAHFKLTNLKNSTIAVIHPEVGSPVTGWEYSNDAYRIAVLQSFHILRITLWDEAGTELNQREMYTLADPVLRRINLSRGDGIDVSIPLDEFYVLESGVRYVLAVQYRVNGITVSGTAEFKTK